jgi:hypothetical protein
VKQRVKPMRGVKRFTHAAIPISGIEVVHPIKKGPCDPSARCAPHSRTPQLWEAVLAAETACRTCGRLLSLCDLHQNLICDLLHLADTKDLDPSALVERAIRHYEHAVLYPDD